MRNNKDDWDNPNVDPWRFENAVVKGIKQYVDNNPDVAKYLKDNSLRIKWEIVKND